MTKTQTRRCPTGPSPTRKPGEDDLRGCGSTNLSEPDDEGLIDCLDCGLWMTEAEATAGE